MLNWQTERVARNFHKAGESRTNLTSKRIDKKANKGHNQARIWLQAKNAAFDAMKIDCGQEGNLRQEVIIYIVISV